jgi:arginine exporter protein ArgO
VRGIFAESASNALSLGVFLRGMVAGYGIAVPIGPIAILILELGIRRGFKTAFSAGAGAASADLIYAAIASVAGGFLVSMLEPYAIPLRAISAVSLIGFGIYLLYRGRKRQDEKHLEIHPASSVPTYCTFLGMTLLNPLTVTYFTALILGLSAGTTSSSIDVVLFVMGAFCASLSWQTLLAGLSGLGHKRLPPKLQSATSIVGNSMVIILGVLILVGFSI